MSQRVLLFLCGCAVPSVFAQFTISPELRKLRLTAVSPDGQVNIFQETGANTSGEFTAISFAQLGGATVIGYVETVQDSIVSEDRVIGSGSVWAEESAGANWSIGGESTLEALLSVTSPQAFRARGSLDATSLQGLSFFGLEAMDHSFALLKVTSSDEPYKWFDEVLVLPPGEYSIWAGSYAFDAPGAGARGGSWSVELAAVPEPATASALVLSALLARKRRTLGL